MLKEHDGPKEPAEKRAERKWKNNQLRQKLIASKVPAHAVIDQNAPPAVATVVTTERPKAKSVTRFENRFKKDIRAMLDEHKERNMSAHLAIIQHQRRRLLLEKIRRLEVRIAEREGERSG
jgi:phosphoglycerate-specific signal transduction histidine kinase